MKSFESVKDILDDMRTFHARAKVLYRRWAERALDGRTKLLLGYMADYEARLEESFQTYEKDAPPSILNTFFQFVPDEPSEKFLDDLDPDPKASADAVLELGAKVDAYRERVFARMAETADAQGASSVREVLRNLQEMEAEARRKLAKTIDGV